VLQLAAHYRRVTRWVAIVVLVAGWGVPLALPHLSNDDLCDVTDSSRPSQLKAWDGQRAPEHCVICHAARTFASSLAAGKPVLVGLLTGNVLVARHETFHDASTFHRLPARAPPVS
jgi:hypothetical protein